MNKKEGILVLILLFIFLLNFASAVADVAYIYEKSFRIDDNVLEVFNDLGLSVDLIKDTNIPSSLSQYKVIFVNDESFANPNRIPVNTRPSIVVNYYHPEDWGLTDAEGASQLAASHPLSVVKDGRTIQVYTRATENVGGPAIPYYYLDVENKAPSLETIALTESTASGSDFGDVISYADAGDVLFAGKIQTAPLCFFGIIESDFWTQSAKELFEDCISHVISECSIDSDCPSPSPTGQPFCLNDDVYQSQAAFTCEDTGPGFQCLEGNNSILIEECQFGCANGQCLNVQCFENLDCGTEGYIGSNFCSLDNVIRNYTTPTCNNAGTPQSFCSNSTETRLITECSDTCSNGACINFECDEDSACDDSNPLTFDECLSPGTPSSECRNTPINCAVNSYQIQ